jgi:MscS family membrane protein
MEYLDKLNPLIKYVQSDVWVLQVFVIVFVSLLVDFIQKRLVLKLSKKLKRTNNFWDDALLDALTRPASFMVWLIGLTFAADVVRVESDAVIFNSIESIRKVGLAIIVTWFLVRFIKNSEENILKQSESQSKPIDRTTADAIAKLLRVSVVITSILMILQTLGYSISGVLAFGGISGIAIGFAAKDLLSNFFGGLMIYLDRPFAVGDWIRSPDREIEGTVEDIGWRLTRIRSFDKRPIYVPNAVFASIAVENPTRMTNRRIYETVGIRYIDAKKLPKIIDDIKQMLVGHPEIDTNQTMIVNLNKFAPSSMDFFVYTFTKTTQWIKFHGIKQDVMLKIIDIIENNNAECAFPTSTVYIPDGLVTSNINNIKNI